MFLSPVNNAKNNRSLISSKFLITEEVGLILVCGHGYSRTIYLELNKAPNERLITKYSIKFPAGSFTSDAANGWECEKFSHSKETAGEIQALKRHSHTVKKYQVDKDSIERFTESMNLECDKQLIFNGKQDDGLIVALKDIDENFEFSSYIGFGCTLS